MLRKKMSTFTLLSVVLFSSSLEAGKFIQKFCSYCKTDGVQTSPGSINLEVLEGDAEGSAKELFDLGRAYFFGYEGQGISTHKSFKDAASFFTQAFKKDFKKAALYLAMMHEDGEGVKKNLNQAIEYYQIAEEAEESFAIYRLGWLFLDKKITSEEFVKNTSKQDLKPGDVVQEFVTYYSTKNEKIFFEPLKKKLEEKCLKMAKAWFFGGKYQIFKIPQNFKQAELWLKWAAENFCEANLYLGMLYEDRGNLEKACECYIKAANGGFHWAWYRLGVLLFDQDNEKSHTYLSLASGAGNKAAKEFLKNFE